MRYFIIIYLILINLIAFISFGRDKQKAYQGKWRTQERTFFIIAFLGGSIGCIIGMRFFKHKTRHAKFKLGMPAVFVLQIIFILLLYLWLK